MLIVPSSVMRSLAVGAILVGIVSVLGGAHAAARAPRPDRRRREPAAHPDHREPLDRGHERRGQASGEAIVARVQRRPWISLGVATALLLAAASPVLGMHIGANSITTLPDRFSSKQAFVELQRDFPAATTDPVRIIVPAGHNQPAVSAALRNLQTQLGRDARFGPPAPIRLSADGDAALLEAPVNGDPSGKRAVAAVRDLRDTVMPAAFRGTGAEPLVGGDELGERRLLRRDDRARAIRLPLRARADVRPPHDRLSLDRRRRDQRSCSTSSRSAPPTGSSCSSSSTVWAPTCSASSRWT